MASAEHSTSVREKPPLIGSGGAGEGQVPTDTMGQTGAMAARDPLERLRRLCLALPEVTERLSHGEPTWFVRDKKVFVMFANNHHDDGRVAFWCAAPAGAQEDMVDSDPVRFFRPPYVGHRGWLGVRVDVNVDWDEVGAIVRQAYAMVAATLPRARESREGP